MLLENQIGPGGFLASSIVGIGLNVNQTEFDPGLVNPVSMKVLTKVTYDIEAELEDLCSRLASNFELCETPEGRKALHENYLDGLYRMGVTCDYTDCRDASALRGRIVGVSPAGMLQFETNEGKLKEFAFKEISYII